MTGFIDKLLAWYNANARDFPFRRTRDPYRIWLSEVIMQQTRIEQGVPYYDKFVNVFPTVNDLAGASEEEVLKQWQGLGYYTRARNLHSTANEVVEKYGGKFPGTYEELRTLKGIGDYTAAAISSVCFGLPRPVMDGNVIRFITRHFGITGAVDQAGTRKEILEVLNELMEGRGEGRVKKRVERRTRFSPRSSPRPSSRPPGLFNQAMIEFGATFCVPRNPNCPGCIFNSGCFALRQGMIGMLPVKKQQQPLKPRYFHYLVISVRGKEGLYFRKRSGNDIWKGLYEFPLLETNRMLTLPSLMNTPGWKQIFEKTPFKVLRRTGMISHLLSHQKIIAKFYRLEVKKPSGKFGILIRPEKIQELPVARILEKYLENHSISEL